MRVAFAAAAVEDAVPSHTPILIIISPKPHGYGQGGTYAAIVLASTGRVGASQRLHRKTVAEHRLGIADCGGSRAVGKPTCQVTAIQQLK